jgi:1-acyl-sn-glycerol-3-phosphate acyltransferase
MKLKKISDPIKKKSIRLEYSKKILSKINISIKVENPELLPQDGQYLLISNHRSIIDPLIIDVALKDSKIFGSWIAKKELYNSFFFGNAVRNGGAIRLDREDHKVSTFFSDIKDWLKLGSSICIFPEGTRNKSQKKLLDFKKGFRIISLKNRLPILPLYIKTNAEEVLQKALKNSTKEQEITITIGNIIDYSENNDLETKYRTIFDLEAA